MSPLGAAAVGAAALAGGAALALLAFMRFASPETKAQSYLANALAQRRLRIAQVPPEVVRACVDLALSAAAPDHIAWRLGFKPRPAYDSAEMCHALDLHAEIIAAVVRGEPLSRDAAELWAAIQNQNASI